MRLWWWCLLLLTCTRPVSPVPTTGDALKEAMKPKLECPMPKVEPAAPQIGEGISCHAPVVVAPRS